MEREPRVSRLDPDEAMPEALVNSLFDLSEEQIAELDRRLDALEAQPKSGTPWHIARERILASL